LFSLVVNDETNLLRLITLWLDNNCQIKPKRAIAIFSRTFRELNTLFAPFSKGESDWVDREPCTEAGKVKAQSESPGSPIDGYLARYPWGPQARPILARPEHGMGPNIIGLGLVRAR